jgi:hypothetical protein
MFLHLRSWIWPFKKYFVYQVGSASIFVGLYYMYDLKMLYLRVVLHLPEYKEMFRT